MLKTSPSSTDPPKIGLVPATYILPAPVLQPMLALYAYEAQTDDELASNQPGLLIDLASETYDAQSLTSITDYLRGRDSGSL